MRGDDAFGAVRHEAVHVAQRDRLASKLGRFMGTAAFEASYAIEHWRHGYMGNQYEIEARAAE